VDRFKLSDLSTCDAPRPVTTTEIIDQIHELILADSWISAKSLVEQLDISLERVGYFIHEDLDMQKLSANWVSKSLNADQKLQKIGDNRRNLVISLRPRDKATINGVAA
jgi:hypothetical protein